MLVGFKPPCYFHRHVIYRLQGNIPDKIFEELDNTHTAYKNIGKPIHRMLQLHIGQPRFYFTPNNKSKMTILLFWHVLSCTKITAVSDTNDFTKFHPLSMQM